MADLTDRFTEESDALWLLRNRATGLGNVRLTDLVRFDERLEASIACLRIAGEQGWATAAAAVLSGGPGAAFAAACLAISRGSAEALDQVIQDGDKSPLAEEPGRALISALSWAEREPAGRAIGYLAAASDAERQAKAIGAWGTRRNDAKEQLERALGHADTAPRARAYRTAGQLGRQDLMMHLRPGLTDADLECRFWSAWAAARMGADEEALGVLAEIAWTNQPRAVRALDLLLRRLELPHANAWLREFAKLPGRQRDLIRATGVAGDPIYIPWLIERMAEAENARLAGEAFSMITGLDLAYRDLDRKAPRDFESGPNDDPADENVALDEDDNLPWPDPGLIGSWWLNNMGHYQNGTAYFLGTPKPATDWLAALSDAFQRQRHAAALELAIRMPRAAMFEVRARGRLQRRLIARSRGGG
jgi:uncharacterized protein (TIGR02270 family)